MHDISLFPHSLLYHGYAYFDFCIMTLDVLYMFAVIYMSCTLSRIREAFVFRKGILEPRWCSERVAGVVRGLAPRGIRR